MRYYIEYINEVKKTTILTWLKCKQNTKNQYFFAWLASDRSKNSIATRPSTELRAYPAKSMWNMNIKAKKLNT